MSPAGQYQPLVDNDDGLTTRPRHASSSSMGFLHPVVGTLDSASQKCLSFVRANAGLLLVAASQGFFALMNVAVKKLNSLDPPVPPLELVAVRMGITYICCISYLLWRKVPDPFLGPKGVRHLLVVRGFSGFFGLFGVYYSLQYLSLSDATVLTFLVPLTTAISGFLFLGEVFHRKEALAGVLSLVGVVLIARPEAIFGPHSASAVAAPGGVDPSENATSGQRLGAVGVALLGVLGATGAYTSMRAIGKRAHTLHSMSYFSLWCVITATVGMSVMQQKFIFPTRLEWLALLIMIGIFGFLAQALLTMGLQRETAGRGAMAIYVQIIFASVLERIFFHTTPSALSVVGTLIIMGSAVYVALTKQTTQTPKVDARADTDSEIALDLELGVAEPETQRFITHENSSHLFLPGSRNLKSANTDQLRGLAGGLEGFKSEGSLHLGAEQMKSKSEVSLSATLGLTGLREGKEEKDGSVVFDVGESGSGSGSDTDCDDDDIDEDRQSKAWDSDGIRI